MTVEDIMQEAMTVKRKMELVIINDKAIVNWLDESDGDKMADGSDDQGYDEQL